MKAVPKPTPKKKKKAASIGKIKKLDNLTRDIVFARDGRCVICGSSERLQWSHLITRKKYATRWDTLNSAVMCAACHFRHHKLGPEAFVLWFLRIHGQVAYEALCRKAYTPLSPAERRELIERLLKEYGGSI